MRNTIFITGIYFLIGAISILYLTLRKKAPEGIWLKYSVYLGIVSIWLSVLHFSIEQYHLLSIIISSGALVEMVFTGRNSSLSEFFLFKSMIVFLFASGYFMAFTFRAGQELSIFVFLVVFCFDGFSQISGNLLGKRKIFPSISPNKTWAGFWGGSIASLIAAILLHTNGMGNIVITLSKSLLICYAGFWGDILASYYKRKNHIKDFSQIIPGHGGFLDRFDSLILAQACAYFMYF